MSYEIYLCDSFKKAVKHYKKRFPHVAEDVGKTVRELQATPAKGDLIRGAKGVRKVRVDNSDMTKGKSGGYRLLYYFIDRPSQRIYLLMLYAKNERDSISSQEAVALLREAGLIST